jgi:GNAT superfamily N-acetyltransferase
VQTDLVEAAAFFRQTIEDTFIRNRIPVVPPTELDQECAWKLAALQADLKSCGAERFFLIAREQGGIVGTVALSPASEFVREHIPARYHTWTSVTTVLVKPACQSMGIGTQLLSAALEELRRREEPGFLLDTGYATARVYWTARLGEPDHVLPQFWYGKDDHCFWIRGVDRPAVPLHGS